MTTDRNQTRWAALSFAQQAIVLNYLKAAQKNVRDPLVSEAIAAAREMLAADTIWFDRAVT